MKKLSILLLAIFFIGIANINAQTEATNESTTAVEEVKDVKTCTKTGKICPATCDKKKTNTCCQSKKEKSSCSKSKKGSFNFNKSNNYDSKSSCSKSKTKKCCKKKAEKATTEEETTEEE